MKKGQDLLLARAAQKCIYGAATARERTAGEAHRWP
jgi:hypothetical protein